MFLKPLREQIIKRSRLTSLRAILVVPFVLQIFGAVGLTGWLSLRNGQQAIYEVTEQLRNEVSARIEQRLEGYLEAPRVIAQINANAIELEQVNVQETASLTRQFWRQRFLFDSMRVSAIYFGAETAEFIGLGFQDNQRWEIGRAGTSTGGKFYSYGVDDQGKPTEILERGRDYDPRVRPWYQNAVEAGQPTWSDIYVDFKDPRLKITLVQPIHDHNQTLLGVVGVDFVLSHIGEFLQTLQIGKSGQTFIMERSGLLVASSTRQRPFQTVGDTIERIHTLELESEEGFLIRKVSRYLHQHFRQDFRQIEQSEQLNVVIDRQSYFLQVMPFADSKNLDWVIVVVVPEADFMEKINMNTRTTIQLCFVALILAIILGIFTSRWITRPILELSAASREIAHGKLAQKVQVKGIDELKVLSDSFNLMAAQLQASFKALKRTNEELEMRVERRAQALTKAEAELRGLFAAMTECVCVFDAQGYHLKIASINPALLYDSHDAWLGKTLREVFEPEIADLLLAGIEKSLATRRTVHLEYCLNDYPYPIWCAGTISPISENSVIWVGRDMTERKLLEEKLKTSEGKMRAVFEGMNDIVLVLKVEGNQIIDIEVAPTNPGRLYHQDIDPISKTIEEFFGDQGQFLLTYIKQALLTQKTMTIDYKILFDPGEFWFTARISPMSYNTVIWVARDMTEHKESELALRIAQQKSEALLLNILPKPIAEKLKQNTGLIAENFAETTILFADIVGFTPLASRIAPIELVNLLNQIFSAFDHLAERYQVEKIKTIGDAYMVAGGLPIPRPDHAEIMAEMALGMLASIQQFQLEIQEPFQIRIGMNSGPVVAGVIGLKKFIYDLWGDTVNVASRMESLGKPGHIQVTETTYQRLKHLYQLEKRGKLEVKGKGEMTTYWLLGHR